MTPDKLVDVRSLTKIFPVTKGFLFKKIVAELKAVNDVSFHIMPGETLGLVGESGCGKSTTGRLMVNLMQPSAGEIYFKGQNIHQLSRAKLSYMRQKMQIVFQDPYSSLNPRKTVSEIIAYPAKVTNLYSGAELQKRVEELLALVGLKTHFINKFPHQFSGGQRQRISIARALAVKPEFIVLDEPVSALDVSVQAQIINLLLDLQKKMSLSYLFISHDLNVIEHLSARIAVMYLGKILEIGSRDDIFYNTLHPYTKALLSAIITKDGKRNKIILEGEIPSPTNIPSGCCFRTRCPIAQNICETSEPSLSEKTDQHFAACHFA